MVSSRLYKDEAASVERLNRSNARQLSNPIDLTARVRERKRFLRDGQRNDSLPSLLSFESKSMLTLDIDIALHALVLPLCSVYQYHPRPSRSTRGCLRSIRCLASTCIREISGVRLNNRAWRAFDRRCTARGYSVPGRIRCSSKSYSGRRALPLLASEDRATMLRKLSDPKFTG